MTSLDGSKKKKTLPCCKRPKHHKMQRNERVHHSSKGSIEGARVGPQPGFPDAGQTPPDTHPLPLNPVLPKPIPSTSLTSSPTPPYLLPPHDHPWLLDRGKTACSSGVTSGPNAALSQMKPCPRGMSRVVRRLVDVVRLREGGPVRCCPLKDVQGCTLECWARVNPWYKAFKLR